MRSVNKGKIPIHPDPEPVNPWRNVGATMIEIQGAPLFVIVGAQVTLTAKCIDGLGNDYSDMCEWVTDVPGVDPAKGDAFAFIVRERGRFLVACKCVDIRGETVRDVVGFDVE